MPTCPFCSRIPQDIADRKIAYAFADNFPVSNGHTLIVPARHVADYFELSVEEQQALWALVNECKQKLDVQHRPAGYNIGINVGAAGGQTVKHVHIHLIPRFEGDQTDPRGGIRWIFPEKAAYWND